MGSYVKDLFNQLYKYKKQYLIEFLSLFGAAFFVKRGKFMINFDKIKKMMGEKIKLLTKRGKRVETNEEFITRVLKDLEENHNHSWYEEIYERNKKTKDCLLYTSIFFLFYKL